MKAGEILSVRRRSRRWAVFTVAAMVVTVGPALGAESTLASRAVAAADSEPAAAAVPPAFPGAEGAGANAKGGRGGDVYYVTTLADSGAGSLRAGIDSAPAGGRTILFKVSGTIALNSNLGINKSNITIAGQSAPGDGIAIRNYTIGIGNGAHDVVIRHIRLRTGANDSRDSMWISSGRNIIIDHVSASWGSDEVISASRDVQDLTVQNTIISEALNRANHGFGSIIASAHDTTYSWHHNLWANNVSRNPRPGTDAPDPGFRLDLRNNVFSNWGYAAGYSGSDDGRIELNYVNNYLVAGPNSTETCAMDSGGSLQNYQSGNMIDLNRNGRVDGSDTGWGMFCGSYTKHGNEWPVPPVTTDSAGAAYARVLAQGGAMPWRRDSVDRRIIDSVRQQNGRIINNVSDVGGWPTLVSEPAPTDTDSDGMPDYWEQALGLNPSNAADRNNTDAAGYTMLENYLNWLAEGHAVVDRNGSVDVDLRALNGGSNLNFTAASGRNGTVTLLGDGRTARFTPATNYSGLANFTYTATDPATGLSFGPVGVGVLVRGNGGPPPTTAPPTTAPPTTAPPTTAPPTTGCRVTYTVNAWNSGLTTAISVTNTSTTTVNGWTLAFTLPSGQTITNGWNATYSPLSGPVKASNVSYNGTIAPNSSVDFGFQATHTGNTGRPSSFTLNGTACAFA
ncbi:MULTISPECIES: cellulose binding domain-containing protein [unclassified Micromonospora]|uniref:cellulose binding domain-containing protein n=1 Tax=unclassified Micromonospora TaxID=2617518 RepID=UPI003A869E28